VPAADSRFRDRRGRGTGTAARLHGAHRRDRRGKIDPRRRAAACRGRSRRQRRGAPRCRTRRGDRSVRSRAQPRRSGVARGAGNRARGGSRAATERRRRRTQSRLRQRAGHARCRRCARSASTCSTSTASSNSSPLARRGYQRDLLDESGRLGAEVAAMRDAFRRWRELDLEREAFAQRLRDRENRIDLLSHYVAELDALSPQADEPRLLAEERRRISSVGRLAEGNRTGGKPACGRRRRRRWARWDEPSRCCAACRPRSGARRHRTTARGSVHRLPGGDREPASVRGYARSRPGAAGMGRGAPRRARGGGPQASRRGRAPAGPAQRIDRGTGGPARWFRQSR